MNTTFSIGADEAGAIVLWEIDESGNATPVSEQNHNWLQWVHLANHFGRSSAALIPVHLDEMGTVAMG